MPLFAHGTCPAGLAGWSRDVGTGGSHSGSGDSGHKEPQDMARHNDDYYLVRIHRRGTTSARDDVHYYRLRDTAAASTVAEKGSWATAAPMTGMPGATSSEASFLRNYNRFSSVMFGQLDPFYYPALQRRHVGPNEGWAIDAGTSNSRDPLLPRAWEEVRSDPLPTSTPIALMQRLSDEAGFPLRRHTEPPMSRGDAVDTAQQSSARLHRDHKRPPYVLLTAAALVAAAIMAGAKTARQKIRTARYESDAWRRVALQLVDRQNNAVLHSGAPALLGGHAAVPPTPVPCQVGSENTSRMASTRQSAASHQHSISEKNTTGAAPTADAQLSRVEGLGERQASVGHDRKRGRHSATTQSWYSPVHPQEDWDWMPADYPQTRSAQWRQWRLPPWCLGFSSAARAKWQSQAAVESGQALPNTGVGKHATARKPSAPSTNAAAAAQALNEDAAYVTEVMRDVFGIDARPRAAGEVGMPRVVQSTPVLEKRSEAKPSDGAAPEPSRIERALKAHRTPSDDCLEAQLLAEDVSASDGASSTHPTHESAYDFEEVVREILEEQSRQRRQRLRSRLAARLDPGQRARLREERAKSAAARGRSSVAAVDGSRDAEREARLVHDYFDFAAKSDVIDAITAEHCEAGSIMDDVAAAEKQTKGQYSKAPSESFSTSSATQQPPWEMLDHARMQALERQVWALIARFDSMIHRH